MKTIILKNYIFLKTQKYKRENILFIYGRKFKSYPAVIKKQYILEKLKFNLETIK